MNLWLTIGHLVRSDLLPEPKIVAPEGERLHVKLRTPDDVNRWVRHLGMPPATADDREYGSVDFRPEPGWCGYTTIRVYCDISVPDRGGAPAGALRFALIVALVMLTLLCGEVLG